MRSAAADGRGMVYVNLDDKSEVVALDANQLTVKARWGLAPGEDPSGMAIDQKTRRLFIGCGNRKMMVVNAAWDIDQGRDARDKVSMIKVAASEMQGRVVDRAIQVFGGMGFSKDLPLERMYRDARVTRIYDGTSEIHRMLVARSTIKNGLQL